MSGASANCFGFIQEGHAPCTWCSAARRCKAISLTHGSDILADLLEHLQQNLPNIKYEDSDRVIEIVRLLRDPKGPDPEVEEAQNIGLRAPAEDEPDIDV